MILNFVNRLVVGLSLGLGIVQCLFFIKITLLEDILLKDFLMGDNLFEIKIVGCFELVNFIDYNFSNFFIAIIIIIIIIIIKYFYFKNPFLNY